MDNLSTALDSLESASFRIEDLKERLAFAQRVADLAVQKFKRIEVENNLLKMQLTLAMDHIEFLEARISGAKN